MKNTNKTTSVRLKPDIRKMLNRLVQKGMSRSFVINEALRRYLFREEFESLSTKMMSLAREKGIYTDEDVTERLS